MARRKNSLAFEPTDDQRREVLLLTGFRMTPAQIGLLIRHPVTGIPLGEEAVRRLFSHELAAGRAMVDAKVAESLYKKAVGNGAQAVTAAMFWARVHMKWREEDATDAAALPAGVLIVPAAVAPSAWVATQQQKNAQRKPPAAAIKPRK